MYGNNNLELLTVTDLCELLSISSNTAYSLLNSSDENHIHALRIGRNWRIPLSSVEKYILTSSKMDQATK
ncbi:MAG: helix-turn-helix domain-containing protein [Eubacterium sp.]|nr:helix-turn-helix domain-containing protein [Eubacterium sp.]